jgi:hypothetical protein
VELISSYEASGETAASFCALRGINEKTFKWWKGKLRSHHARTPGPAPAGPRLLPVVVRSRGGAGGPEVRVRVGGAEIAFEAGLDAHYIARLAGALRATC